MPHVDAEKNIIATPFDGINIHVLGPPRSAELLKKMNPPKAVRWLEEADGEALPATTREDLFDSIYQVPTEQVETRIPSELIKTRNSLRLNTLAYDEDALLAVASVLEQSVNNTSVFFVLNVRGNRFVFVGDSQQGAWNHVLDSLDSRQLVTGATFYKVGHHGSHNATPRRFVEDTLGDHATAMVPVGFVKAWSDSIPNQHLLDGLALKETRVIRADAPPPEGGDVRVDRDSQLWTEISFIL